MDCFFLQPTITGLATKTITRGAPLPTEHSKIFFFGPKDGIEVAMENP